MAQLVTRVDDELAAHVDALVRDGVVRSRSEAVRRGLEALVEQHRRARIGAEIVAGYERLPQSEDDGEWTDEATRQMIAEEPW